MKNDRCRSGNNNGTTKKFRLAPTNPSTSMSRRQFTPPHRLLLMPDSANSSRLHSAAFQPRQFEFGLGRGCLRANDSRLLFWLLGFHARAPNSISVSSKSYRHPGQINRGFCGEGGKRFAERCMFPQRFDFLFCQVRSGDC